MTNLFLQINKDLFELGMNPTEIIILAQVMEFNRNTGDCFMSDKQFAAMLNVSDKTVSRALKELEDRGFITRETKNIKGGKERHIKVNLAAIESAAVTTDKMSVVDSQGTKSPLTKDNLSVDNGQNDLIKDNNKIKIKDNSSDETIFDCLHPHLEDCMDASSAEEFKNCW
jgi:DNA-binding MarR family transcriptional regulator